MMVMAKEAISVFGKIPDDHDVYHQDSGDEQWMTGPGRVVRGLTMDQFVNLNRNKKRGLANSHPTSPAYTKDEADTFDERKQTINEGAGGSPEHIHFSDVP